MIYFTSPKKEVLSIRYWFDASSGIDAVSRDDCERLLMVVASADQSVIDIAAINKYSKESLRFSAQQWIAQQAAHDFVAGGPR
jgi:hypothetical protein